MIAARLIRDLQAELADGAQFDVYFHSPSVIEIFFRNIQGFRRCLHDDVFAAAIPSCSFALVANQFVHVVGAAIDHRLQRDHSSKIAKIFEHQREVSRTIVKYINAHPFFDGAFADLAVRQGHKRRSYLHDMLGLAYGGDLLPLALDPTVAGSLALAAGSYITVHDGWDTMLPLGSTRPVKALPLPSWEKIIAEIKRRRPDLRIVQLGACTGSEIPGVDVNLRNRLSFEESVSVLTGSLLHLDTESGLVHVATALGVRSVVMFGPTNAEWFGYPQNINIAPRQCGNCWWSTDDWMDVCAAGHATPVCTCETSIVPAEVAEEAIAVLAEIREASAPARRCGEGG